MRFSRILTIAAALAALSVGATRSNAGTITDLNNTGLAAFGAVDPNYSVLSVVTVPASVPSSGPSFVVGPNGTFPIPPWVADSTSPLSNWTSGPLPGPSNTTNNGLFTYRTTFTTSDTGIATIVIANMTADDQIVGININGAPAIVTGLPFPTTNEGYATLFGPYTATATVLSVPGVLGSKLNTLDFVVNNTKNVVEGLRVQGLTGQTGVVPEPASLVMLGSGLIGILGLAGLRRMKKVA